MASSRTDDELLIRKYRKKLRQIEKLELLDRELTEEEEVKFQIEGIQIENKGSIRGALLELISRYGNVANSDPSWVQQAVFGQSDESPNVSRDSAIGEQLSNSELYLEPSDIDDRDEEDEDAYDEDAEDAEDESEDEEEEKENDHAPVNVQKPATTSRESDHRQKRETTSSIEPKSHPVPAKKAKCEQDKPEPKPKESKQQTIQSQWRNARFSVAGLEGHSDLVCSISVCKNLMLTGSRDTTVKLWNLKTLLEIRSFGGHTGGVSKVLLLTPEQSQSLVNSLYSNEAEKEGDLSQLAISGAQDCSIKIWDIHTGRAIRSVYAFSPVTCLTLIHLPHAVVLYTTGGGKVEIWDPKVEEVTESLQCHEGKITGLCVEGNYVYTAGQDGYLKVHEFRETKLHTVYESEDVKGIRGASVQLRPVQSMTVNNKIAFIGDDGTNVKALDWTKGEVHKLSNHTIDFGSTNAVCSFKDLMISSGYAIDNGIGYMNVRHLPSEKYLCSLCDEDTSRIVCLACTQSDNRYTLVTGGMELVVWKQISSNYPSEDDAYVLESQYIPTFDRAARNSDVETEGELSETESEPPADVPSFPKRRSSDTSDQNKGWLSWCSIL